MHNAPPMQGHSFEKKIGCSIIKEHLNQGYLFHFCGFKHFEAFFNFLEILVKHSSFSFYFKSHVFVTKLFSPNCFEVEYLVSIPS
jgi:hypothetical protein